MPSAVQVSLPADDLADGAWSVTLLEDILRVSSTLAYICVGCIRRTRETGPKQYVGWRARKRCSLCPSQYFRRVHSYCSVFFIRLFSHIDSSMKGGAGCRVKRFGSHRRSFYPPSPGTPVHEMYFLLKTDGPKTDIHPVSTSSRNNAWKYCFNVSSAGIVSQS